MEQQKFEDRSTTQLRDLEYAVSARVAGRLTEADAIFERLLAQPNPTTPTFMEAGLCKLALGDFDAAFRIFSQTYAGGAVPSAAIWCGVALRRKGNLPLAIEYLRHAFDSEKSVATAIELGGCLEAIGSHKEAISLYREAQDITILKPDSFIFNRLGVCLERIGAIDELSKLITSTPYLRSINTDFSAASTIFWAVKSRTHLDDGFIWQLAAHHQRSESTCDALTLYISNNSKPQVDGYYFFNHSDENSYYNDAIYVSSHYKKDVLYSKLKDKEFLEINLAVEVIIDAIQSSRPFSFIRLGDGEGNMIAHHLFPNSPFLLKQYDRILSNWFGSSRMDARNYSELERGLISSVQNSDLLGVPNIARVEFESQSDARGYWGVYFASLHCCSNIDKNIKFTSPVAHLYMFQNENFRGSLKSAHQVHTVSCHEDLGTTIRSRLSLNLGSDFVVPGEMGKLELPVGSRVGLHYPDVYLGVIKSIEGLDPGGVVLVAAGVCGKVYVDAAKRAGCIGIDIGAIADHIMGFKTRGVFESSGFAADVFS